MARARSDITPSLLGSALLHGGLLALTLVSWPWFGKRMEIGAPVPVTIVASAPVTNIRPAEQAPQEAEAMTEAPEPEATPEPASPPRVEALVAPSSPKPAPKKQVQPKALDLDALAESLKPSRPPKPKSSARKGAARPETAVQARVAAGQASAAAKSALSVLGAEVGRRWNPNCDVKGGADITVRITFELNRSGYLVGEPQVSGESSDDPVLRAAAIRAKSALRASEPFRDLPGELYDERLVLNFPARDFCASG